MRLLFRIISIGWYIHKEKGILIEMIQTCDYKLDKYLILQVCAYI